MSSRVAVGTLLLLCASAAWGQDWADFALHSTPRDDPLLIDTIRQGDLQTALSICAGVGVRAAGTVGALIDALASDAFGRGRDRAEALLRTLLHGLLDPNRSDLPLAQRVARNGDALGRLLEVTASLQDPQLVGELVRIIPFLAGPQRLPALMEAGDRVVAALRRGSGRLMPTEASLAMDVLAAARQTADPDYLPLCSMIARLSTDPDIVQAARAAAAALRP